VGVPDRGPVSLTGPGAAPIRYSDGGATGMS